jgi:lipopolysaccharide transport system ATP-binding protein
VHEERVGEQVFVCDIPSLPLVPGEYKVNVGLDIASHEVDWVDDAARLTVIKSDYYGTGIVPIRGTFLVQNRWALNGGTREVARVS